jgi:archaemetzincin
VIDLFSANEMKKSFWLVAVLLSLCWLLFCPGVRAVESGVGQQEAELYDKLASAIEKLKPLHQKMGPPQPGDWLLRFKESGQTFKEYLTCRPVMPRGKRKIIYIQPLGAFGKKQRQIINLTAEFMGLYFNVAVKVRKDLALSLIPAKARRVHPNQGMKQILAGYVLDHLLKPRLPADAAACIAFTSSDLWPGKGWNFVFGLASLSERVGVWSIYRNGDPSKGQKEFQLCLLRTIKLAVHETGHMFSLRHCTAYECNMCGCNNRAESDRRHVFCCPECLAKICWAGRADPIKRYRKLAEWFKKNGFKKQTAFCHKSIKALGPKQD